MTARFKLANPIHLLALGLGSGLLKPAPGTWGTLAAIPVYLIVVSWLSPFSVAYLGICAFAFLIGIYICGRCAEDVGVHDHSAIVWDEWVGLLVSFAFIQPSLTNLLLGFLLFRFFDIVKPWPIKRLDRSVHGGFGIMVDDLIAGVFACLVLQVAQAWLI